MSSKYLHVASCREEKTDRTVWGIVLASEPYILHYGFDVPTQEGLSGDALYDSILPHLDRRISFEPSLKASLRIDISSREPNNIFFVNRLAALLSEEIAHI